MQQILLKKMKINQQMIINLKNLGFKEVKTDLYVKNISNDTMIFRDYRGSESTTYAYYRTRRIPVDKFREARAIEKIEEAITKQDLNKLTAYA